MIWESAPMLEIRSTLDSLQIEYLVFDPCSNRPDAGDFLDIMHKNIEQLSDLTHDR
jgi:zinc transport system substrate-binding protein